MQICLFVYSNLICFKVFPIKLKFEDRQISETYYLTGKLKPFLRKAVIICVIDLELSTT